MTLFLPADRKRRRRRWRPPNAPTSQARAVWRVVYPNEPWPRGWRVEWAGFMRRTLGLCLWDSKRILLSYADARRPNGAVVETLVHEFVHVRCPNLRHGKEFERLTAAALSRINLGVTP